MKTGGKMKKFKEGQAEQILSDLFFEFIKVAELLKPKVIVAENVKGIILGNAKGYVNEIIKRLDNIGYETQIFLLNSATMGVPQRRERVFFISRRKDLKLPKINLSFNEKPILYKEFKEENYKPFNKETLEYKRWQLRKPSDLSIGEIVKRTEKGKVSCFSHKIIHNNEVPLTLTAGAPFIRYDKPGYISDKDTMIIQTFPIDYNFMDQQVQYVCGMSVPPLMMKRISKEIEKQIFKGGTI